MPVSDTASQKETPGCERMAVATDGGLDERFNPAWTSTPVESSKGERSGVDGRIQPGTGSLPGLVRLLSMNGNYLIVLLHLSGRWWGKRQASSAEGPCLSCLPL